MTSRLPLTLTLLAAAAALTSCGGGGGAEPARVGGATGASGARPVATPIDPCALATPAQLTRALGAPAPTGGRTGARCTYREADRGAEITVQPPSAGLRQTLTAAPAPPGGGRRVRGAGYAGLVAPVRGLRPEAPAQASISLAGGRASVTIVLTAPPDESPAVLRRAIALARAVAPRV